MKYLLRVLVISAATAALTSCGGGGGGSGSSPANITAPTSLAAVATSDTDISLTWTDTSSNETGFKVERSTDGMAFSQIGTTSADTAFYADAGLVDMTKYYYRVRASNSAEDSVYSNSANATTQPTAGLAWFSSPYASNGSADASPTTRMFAESSAITTLDVGIVVDTTASMGGTITSLKSALSTTVVPALQALVPDVAIGIAGQDDFPYGTYGNSTAGDLPFYVPAGGYITTSTSDSQTAINSLTTHDGVDEPESQVPAMYRAITGASLAWTGGGFIAAASPPAGTFGGLYFRDNALPVVMNLTDISFHNGKRALDKTGATYDSAFQNAYSFATYNVDQLVTQLNSVDAKFIGGAADGGIRGVGTSDPYGYMAYIADKSASYAPPSAFTPRTGCTAGQCCTGVSGAGVAPDGPTINSVQQCRMIFSYNTNGTGLSTSLIDGIKAMLNSLDYDIYVQLYNDLAETGDAVGNLVQKIEPVPAGGTDSVTLTACATFNASLLQDNFTGPENLVASADGIKDTISQVGGPQGQYCFKLTPKPNSSYPPTTMAQVHKIWLRTLLIKPSGATLTLGDDQPIYFIVP